MTHATTDRTNRTRRAGQPMRLVGHAPDAHWAYTDELPADLAKPRELPLYVVAWPSVEWWGITFVAGGVAAWLVGVM